MTSLLITKENGDKFWTNTDGLLHYEDGPAIEYADGDKEWWINGELHREDGPARVCSSGRKYWYIKGVSHREDGPAVEWADGTKAWYRNGKPHCEDGPAVECADGEKLWYIFGTRFTEQEFNIWIDDNKNAPKTSNISDIFNKKPDSVDIECTKRWNLSDGGYVTVYKKGGEYWHDKQERLHREDGPAVERADGSKEWWIGGKIHREGGPAVENINGDKHWYIKGMLHRIDGPAIELFNGNKCWYINGMELTEKEFNKWRDDANKIKNTITMITNGYGHKFWKNENGEFHREGGPAVEHSDGSKFWYINGKLHRVDGTAVEWCGGRKEWWINDKELTEKQFNKWVIDNKQIL